MQSVAGRHDALLAVRLRCTRVKRLPLFTKLYRVFFTSGRCRCGERLRLGRLKHWSCGVPRTWIARTAWITSLGRGHCLRQAVFLAAQRNHFRLLLRAARLTVTSTSCLQRVSVCTQLRLRFATISIRSVGVGVIIIRFRVGGGGGGVDIRIGYRRCSSGTGRRALLFVGLRLVLAIARTQVRESVGAFLRHVPHDGRATRLARNSHNLRRRVTLRVQMGRLLRHCLLL